MEVKESTITLLNKRMAEMDAEIKELEIKRDELAAKNRLQAQTLDKVVAERDKLREALERYGVHDYYCQAHPIRSGKNPCSCGLTEALHKDNTIDHTQDWEGWGKGPNLSYEQVAEMVKQEKPITPQEADNG